MHDEKLLSGGWVNPWKNRIIIPATATTRVRYRDQCNLKNLYIMLHEWFVEEGYTPRSDKEWPEPFYLLRDGPRGKEHWLWWRFKKIPDDGNNHYYRYLIDIFWHVNNTKDIEVIHNGQKFKTNDTDLEIDIRSAYEMDFEYVDSMGKKGWRAHWFLKHIHHMFAFRIFKGENEIHRIHLYRETYRLQEAIKTFLKMRTYMSEIEGGEQWPELGIGDKPGLDVK